LICSSTREISKPVNQHTIRPFFKKIETGADGAQKQRATKAVSGQ
jgi:hypothetical protein